MYERIRMCDNEIFVLPDRIEYPRPTETGHEKHNNQFF